MVTLASKIDTDLTRILSDVGMSVTVYLNPTYTLDNEGNASITKGTATSATALIFNVAGELWTPEMEGVDRQKVLNCYLDNTNTIDEQDIIKWNDIYYKINEIDPHPLGTSTATYYRLEIERIQPQSKVS